MAKIKVICPKCGSDDVVCDACARWDVESQSWTLCTEYDDRTCEACGYESHSFAEAPAESTSEPMKPADVALTDRERDTILAALRRWQKTAYVHSAMHGPGAFAEWDIATNGGTLEELSYDEIDRLCDRLNA
jgi:hypothetical protein